MSSNVALGVSSTPVAALWPVTPVCPLLPTDWSVPSVKPLCNVYEPLLPQVAATITISPSSVESGSVAIGLGVVPVVPLLSEAPTEVVWSTF
ncbi:hypothetical protein ES708_23127 [subsurface metagenome]